MKGLIELAELLLEKEVIFSEDLVRIFGKRKADVLKDEREAEAKAAREANTIEEKKEVNKDKKTAETSSEKTKGKSAKKERVSEEVSPGKTVKKAKPKGKSV